MKKINLSPKYMELYSGEGGEKNLEAVVEFNNRISSKPDLYRFLEVQKEIGRQWVRFDQDPEWISIPGLMAHLEVLAFLETAYQASQIQDYNSTDEA